MKLSFPRWYITGSALVCFREGDKKGFHTFPLPSFQYVVILEEGIGPKRVPKQTSHHIGP